MKKDVEDVDKLGRFINIPTCDEGRIFIIFSHLALASEEPKRRSRSAKGLHQIWCACPFVNEKDPLKIGKIRVEDKKRRSKNRERLAKKLIRSAGMLRIRKRAKRRSTMRWRIGRGAIRLTTSGDGRL